MKKSLILLTFLLLLTGCGRQAPAETVVTFTEEAAAIPAETNTEETAMKLWINDTEVPVIWEENETVRALMEQVQEGDITVSMSMYGGNEQVGPLGRRYPRNDVQTTTENGDIVLYSGDQIVVFYGSNSWAYTRLGHIQLEAWEVTDLLANGNVTLRLNQ